MRQRRTRGGDHYRAAVEGAVRDDELCDEIIRLFGDNYRVYGARKVWRQLLREDVPVPRCTIERLMRRLGLQGARRGKIAARPRPTRPKPGVSHNADSSSHDQRPTDARRRPNRPSSGISP